MASGLRQRHAPRATGAGPAPTVPAWHVDLVFHGVAALHVDALPDPFQGCAPLVVIAATATAVSVASSVAESLSARLARSGTNARCCSRWRPRAPQPGLASHGLRGGIPLRPGVHPVLPVRQVASPRREAHRLSAGTRGLRRPVSSTRLCFFRSGRLLSTLWSFFRGSNASSGQVGSSAFPASSREG